jgi:NitT/TauT family transport system ATP-binding protein
VSAIRSVTTGDDVKDTTGRAAAGRPTCVELRGVTKSFAHGREQRLVLDRIDLDVSQGEFCAIVGPSGCGKSSILRIVDGLVDADSGTVTVNGRAVTEPSDDVGLVFQQFNLLPWKTVRSNIHFGLSNLGLSKAEREERARHWISVVGLEGFEEYHPRQLSGGMQQRVSLARTMARNPSLVLMDEPFGALDALTRTYLQQELVRLFADGERTGILVTHDIEEALLLADRVWVMSSRPGQICDVITVPFAPPRDEAVRISREFAELKHRIWRLLSEDLAARSPYLRSRL